MIAVFDVVCTYIDIAVYKYINNKVVNGMPLWNNIIESIISNQTEAEPSLSVCTYV